MVRSGLLRLPRLRRRRRRGRWQHVFAAIDLGTNNCRLLVARPSSFGFRVIDAFARITRLGEGVSESGQLSESAMQRTIEALKICARRMARREVTIARCVATEACRRASNAAEFVERVRRETGLHLEIIQGEEEAGLALSGCMPLIDRRRKNCLVFDIGGGSTELMWLRPDHQGHPKLHAFASFPLGVVNLSEKLGGREVSNENYQLMIDEMRRLTEPFSQQHGLSALAEKEGLQLLGTSGTVTTLAAVHLNLVRYDRFKVDGMEIPLEDYLRAARRVTAMPFDERLRHPCIGEGRADLVIAGCAILEALGMIWPSEKLSVADRGVREGILQGLMEKADLDQVDFWQFQPINLDEGDAA